MFAFLWKGTPVAKTIKTSFDEYKSNLEIPDRQTTLVSTRRTNVVNAIKAELSLHTSPSYLIGSYDRRTMTRFLSEADVDTMVVLHWGDNKHWDNADGTIKALDKFKAILDKAYPTTEKRRDRNAITMKFSEFRLDVVPAFKQNDYDTTFRIPDSVRKEWVKTDPISFASKITAINTAMGGTFVPLIKMVKGWNRNVGWPIRSFHLECLMEERYRYYSFAYTYDYLAVNFFEALPGLLRSYCYDPVTWDRVDGYLDNSAAKTNRQIAIEKAEKAAKDAREAYNDQTLYPNAINISINEWKALFGYFFPAYG